MNQPMGPALRRRLLAQELEKLRKAAGLETTAVAEALRCDRSRISHLESGRTLPRHPDLVMMLQLYGASDRLQALDELREAANERGWWAQYRLPAWLQAYVGLESDATSIRCFALELVPGLLQNYDYAKAAFLRQGTPHDEVQRLASARMERQCQVGTNRALSVVVSEALLHRTLGMGPVGTSQVRWLVEAVGSRGVELRVLQFAAGGHRSMSGSFTLLGFPEGTADPVAYREGALHGDLTDDPGAVDELDTAFAELTAGSLDPVDTAAMLKEFLARADRGEG